MFKTILKFILNTEHKEKIRRMNERTQEIHETIERMRRNFEEFNYKSDIMIPVTMYKRTINGREVFVMRGE